MMPILFTVGPVSLYSFSLFLVLSWCVWSFLFWQKLRDRAVNEEQVFDLMFYTTLVSFVFSRVWYILMYPNQFSDNWLKIVALWVAPGFSLLGAVVPGVIILFFLSKHYKHSFGVALDAFTIALTGAMVVGEIGSFLDGTVVGLVTKQAWGVSLVGHIGKRHPVQVYEIIILVILLVTYWLMTGQRVKGKWSDGIFSMWFFFFFSLSFFGVEFFKEGSVYWHRLSINQWVYIVLLGQALGAFFVWGGGSGHIRTGAKLIYAKFSKRHS